jgi:predicted metal-binding membrane protein
LLCGDDLPYVDHHDDAAKRRAGDLVGCRARMPAGERFSINLCGQFALGYVTVWGEFSLIATGLQFVFDRAGLLSETMASGSVILAGLLAIAAGVYQWTPWKQACLRHCRLTFWRDTGGQGRLDPMRAGAWHGVFCLDVDGLLFVGGLMNVLSITGLALLVLIEKLFPIPG